MAPVYSTGSSPDDICTIKQVIADMKARLKDPDLARLFENTFPNTLGMTPHFLTVDNIKLQSLQTLLSNISTPLVLSISSRRSSVLMPYSSPITWRLLSRG